MNLSKEIQELVNENVISNEIAKNIQAYYANKQTSLTNKLFIVFGILGGILIGLGIILILAHNWDDLSISTKTALAFIPLIIGQVVCGITLLKKRNNTAWIESSSAFLFFAVGASMALISQIYNIPGNLGTYVLTWMLLCLPIIYLLKSSITSLLYIAGITFYACEIGYFEYPRIESYNYWLLLIAIIPYYYQLFVKKPKSNFTVFHNWLVPLSIIISLGIVSNNFRELMYIPYFSLFGSFYLIGQSTIFKDQKLINNSFKILGSLGTIIMLLMLSFKWYWKDLIDMSFSLISFEDYAEIIAAIVVTLFALFLLLKQTNIQKLKQSTLIEFVFIIFIVLLLIGLKFTILPIILINISLFIIGILIIRKGATNNHFGILNYGLLIITTQVICRFFDTDLSFIVRGLLFILVGVGFFATNYWMLKKRKSYEK